MSGLGVKNTEECMIICKYCALFCKELEHLQVFLCLGLLEIMPQEYRRPIRMHIIKQIQTKINQNSNIKIITDRIQCKKCYVGQRKLYID